ncbi:hypothetical protein TWF694_006909 [Orbilia ellipsospora]|uniref:Uncharacterized protein n=1 Tax=Orbilia ellipsospora TaxID=2528407 RepID=A0AAV9XQ03_9PEZI
MKFSMIAVLLSASATLIQAHPGMTRRASALCNVGVRFELPQCCTPSSNGGDWSCVDFTTPVDTADAFKAACAAVGKKPSCCTQETVADGTLCKLAKLG